MAARLEALASCSARGFDLRLVVGLALTALLLLDVTSRGGSLDQGLLIGLGLLAVKFFGSRSDDADEDVQGKHPGTRFLFGAMNSGRFDDAADVVDKAFRAYANGYPMLVEEVEQGPELVESALGYWREALPDVHWELYDEAVQKQDDGSELIAMRFVSRQQVEDERREIEIGGFARARSGQLTELRLVLDLTLFNEYRAAVGLPLIE